MTSAINSLNGNTNLTAEEKRRVIEEEAKALEQLKVFLYKLKHELKEMYKN